MARTPCIFTNPNDGSTYQWPINYAEMEEFGRERAIEATANTGNVGLVRQQGADQPMIFRVTGTILTEAHYQAFWLWWTLSNTQTFYFTDVDGDQYEVQITSYKPVKKRAASNPKGGATNPTWYWTYTMEMTVYRFISGVLHDSGVVP